MAKRKKDKDLIILKQKKKIEDQQVQLQTLQEEIAYLQLQLKELQSKIFKKNRSKKKKDAPPPEDSEKKKKHGAPWGHLPWLRKKPKKIDQVIEVHLDQCPECGSKDLVDTGEVQEHIQEDIVIPQVKTTCYQKHQYRCQGCKQCVEGQGAQELPGSYIGPVAKTASCYLKYHTKVSDRDIQKIFQNFFGLTIVPSSIPGFRNQLRKKFEPVYEAMIEKMRKSSFLYVDETGWRLNGKNQWLWSFSNKELSVSNIQAGRGQKNLQHVLGDAFNGLLISDFLSAYNKIKVPARQRCLVHLLRDLKRVRECLPEDVVLQKFCKRLQTIIQKAMKAHQQYRARKITKRALGAKRRGLEESLKDLQLADPTHRIVKRFMKRLNRHKHELLTFLDHPKIEGHNNLAERQIRPHVILRKITFQNRSQKGIMNHNVLSSIIQTAKLNGLNPFKVLQDLLFNFDQPNALASVIPP
jgi:transposase